MTTLPNRSAINPAVMQAADDAYALLNKAPRVVTVSPLYWLAALPAVVMCIMLLVAFPNPGAL